MWPRQPTARRRPRVESSTCLVPPWAPFGASSTIPTRTTSVAAAEALEAIGCIAWHYDDIGLGTLEEVA